MGRSIGHCFRFYIDHFSDMEALYKLGYATPKNVTPEKWRKVRAVILHAGSQATKLLREGASTLESTVKSSGVGYVMSQDQRQTLARDWSIRVSLYSTVRKSFAEAGLAFDVPENGRALLCLWLASWSTSKSSQRDLLHVLHAQGLNSAKPADGKDWPRHYIVLDVLEVTASVDRDECMRWVADTTGRALVPSWDKVRHLLES